jgi:hypothetical protein
MTLRLCPLNALVDPTSLESDDYFDPLDQYPTIEV